MTAARALDLSKIPLSEKVELLRLLETREDMLAQRLFFHLFPDEDLVWTGPTLMGGLIEPGQTIHSRHKYPRHLEFFQKGAQYTERCFMAANRCVTPWTYLQTPAGEGLSAEVWTSPGAHVISLDGVSLCDAQPRDGLFLGIEPAFRVILGNGQFFDCSRRHRVLTREGWLSLDQLVSLSSGLRCWHRRTDYQASCAAGGYLGDRPLRSVAGIDLALPLQRGDVRGRAPLIFEHTDAAERTLRRIRACPQRDRLSSPDDLRRFADLFALFSGPSSAQPYLSLSESSLDVQRLALELAPHLRSAAVFHLGQCVGDALRGAAPTVFVGDSCMRIVEHAKHLSSAQWCDAQVPGGSVQEWSRDAEHMPIFYPSEHPQLVGDQIIAAIVPLGLQPIIDAHVPVTNNYVAGGVIHHNTGKTFSGGGFEIACHLTGLYPDWWEGRRFSHPVSVWAAGDTYETTRDILQLTLLGEITYRGPRKIMDGRGVVPGYTLGEPTWRQGVQGLVDTIPVKHVSGGWSQLGLKSYDQGRRAFQGTARHIIWADEEPPPEVYGEMLMRTATVRGMTMLTFTPLSGLSEVVLSFMPREMRPDLSEQATIGQLESAKPW